MVDQMKRIRCPRCSTMLKVICLRKLKHPTGAILDICDRCGGMWLDRDEVALLYEKSSGKQEGKKQSKTKVR